MFHRAADRAGAAAGQRTRTLTWWIDRRVETDMRRTGQLALALVLAGGIIAVAQQPQVAPAPAVPGTTAQAAIDAAAAALGGAERILKLRNITLIGYAQYAYQNGGGNITALPGAPQKFIAANDYRRVYDLEHGRMRHHERRNDLFPFAALRRPRLRAAEPGARRRRRLQRQRTRAGRPRRRRARPAHVDAHEPGRRRARGAERSQRPSPTAGRRTV